MAKDNFSFEKRRKEMEKKAKKEEKKKRKLEAHAQPADGTPDEPTEQAADAGSQTPQPTA